MKPTACPETPVTASVLGPARTAANTPARRVRLAQAGLASIATALLLVACGGGGSSAGGGTPAPVPVPGPGPAPGPVTVAEYCAVPGTGGTAPGGSESPSNIGAKIDAYANCTSVFPGQKITFHVSDNAGSATEARDAVMKVYRVGKTDKLELDTQVAMKKQSIPKDAWANCCNWPISYTLTVPADWETGFYKAGFRSPDGGEPSWVSFVVKSITPGAASKLVFQVPFDTSQMYNSWGGKSAYTFNSTAGVKANIVSNRRPSETRDGNELILGVVQFIRWAEEQKIGMEYLAGDDLHTTPGVLDSYKAFLTVGHDEYWSQPMRDELDRYIDAGGNAAIMSGNTMWWRTIKATDAYGESLGKLIGYREFFAAPHEGAGTGNWFNYDNETRTIGASYFKGGYVNRNSQETLINESYTVYEPGHWAFKGTGLALGGSFGGDDKIHSYESDGADLTFVNGKPVPTGSDSVPADATILAYTALPTGWDSPSTTSGFAGQGPTFTGDNNPNAVMITFTRPNGGGTVFNFGTTDYYRALMACTGTGVTQSKTCKIAENVLTHLSGQDDD